ncbi:hypothetical protein ACH44C_08160 [Streptomyces purpureus]|uniref:hypothetical protein n=1 Tax=Streptomyces purpureus TaxID=1951 RepID=UPI0037BB2970
MPSSMAVVLPAPESWTIRYGTSAQRDDGDRDPDRGPRGPQSERIAEGVAAAFPQRAGQQEQDAE